jgi:hypothetical protein
MTIDTTGVDLGLGTGGGDLNFAGSSANSAGGLDFSNDQDMFGPLTGADFDFSSENWGSMDLS